MENHKSVIPCVSIIGRPNVGKSSLFNCLLNKRHAVVFEQSGTTRDRVEAVIPIEELQVKIIDTGGYAAKDKDTIAMSVKEQIYIALEEAAVLLFVTDVIAGLSPLDIEVAAILRKVNKPVLLVANKSDNNKLESEAAEFYQLGFGEPYVISCVQRRGILGLKEKIYEMLPDKTVLKEEQANERIRIAVVGRPNVGKSSFINHILAKDRVIVSDIPGTTRDSIDTNFCFQGTDYVLIDTAGIRHKRKVKEPVDVYSIMRSHESIKRADIVILMLDAADGMTRDDGGILEFICENGKACLVFVNKWDLASAAEGVSIEEYRRQLMYAHSVLNRFPIEFGSCKTGKNITKCFSIANLLYTNLGLKVSTPFLNKLFEKKSPGNVPVPRRKKKPNFFYIVQSGARPVEFKYFVSDPRDVMPTHLSFIENQLRENLPLLGIPIKISVRKSNKGK